MREGPPDSHKAQKQRKVKVLVTYLYLTLCEPTDCSPALLTLCEPTDCSPALSMGFSRQEY